MEVGAVKQAFNNEVIQLKRNLNQARIQIIHKLTRKAKTFVEKKAPEKLKDKFKRKAESAVNEVLILKKVKPRDIARFTVTHTGNLQDYLNKPTVDQDKACARLLLHKSLQEKYKIIRNTFSGIPIKDLLMSRNERLKLKREARLDKKMKKDKKQKVVNAVGEWDVENLNVSKKVDRKNANKKIIKNDSEGDEENELDEKDDPGNENAISDDEDANLDDEKADLGNDSAESDDQKDEQDGSEGDESEKDENEEGEPDESEADSDTKMETDQESDNEEEEDNNERKLSKFAKPSLAKVDTNQIKNVNLTLTFDQLGKNRKKPEIKKSNKSKDIQKNKNLNSKLQSRKFKKESNESAVKGTKIVDPFFITSTGENYMSVAEPRQPDEIKEIHKQGNRKERRAAMFGHVPKVKPRQDFKQNNFNKQNNFSGFKNKNQSDERYNNRGTDGFKSKNDASFRGKNDQFRSRNDKPFEGRNHQFKGRNDNRPVADQDDKFKGRNDRFQGKNDQDQDRNNGKFKGRSNDAVEPKVEKLHPSWEAKKKQSGILPFQGKKIVFDEG